MAAATGQRFSNGSLNSHLHGHANGKYPGAAHHHHIMHGLVGGDATGGATEQFPPFDPLHDGSGEDVIANGNGYDDDDDDDYTHSSTRTRTQEAHAMNGNDNGSVSSEEEEQEQEGGKEEARSNALQKKHHSDGEMGEDEEDEQSHTPMSNLDPVPESDLHCHQQEVAAHQPQCRDDNASTTSEMTTTTTATVLSPVTSPPYWALAHTDALHPSSHPFNDHHINHSTESLIPGAITLQDNEADDDDDGQGDVNGHQNHNGEPQRQRTPEETRTSYGRDRNKACWAKSVEVTNYVIVNGSATNIGAFVVWNIRVQTLSGPYMNIRKRYSEFDDFRHRLIQTFPNFEAAVPVLPPKSVIAKFRPRFLEKRRAGLQYFLNCILLNPEFSGSPVLKDFLFA